MRRILLAIAAAAGGLAQTRAPKPDLHGGGAKPSLIPNHEVTTVTLPGFHFTGAEVSVRGPCRLAGYKVVSDTEIEMNVAGNRSIDDKEDGCFFTVRTSAGSATSWIVVGLTREEEQEKAKRKENADRAKFDAMVRAAGRKWVVHFGDGVAETYTVQPAEGLGEPPKFGTADGRSATIVVQADGSVFFLEGKCVRGGKLVEGQVKNGESMPGCDHPGSWSATVER